MMTIIFIKKKTKRIYILEILLSQGTPIKFYSGFITHRIIDINRWKNNLYLENKIADFCRVSAFKNGLLILMQFVLFFPIIRFDNESYDHIFIEDLMNFSK